MAIMILKMLASDDGLLEFLITLLEWLTLAPRRMRCDFCGKRVWVHGYRSYYGQFLCSYDCMRAVNQYDDYEIPF